MSSLNKVQLIGRLGNAPELRYTTSNKATCELRVATSRSWTDREGQKQEETEWHSVVVWEKTAENCERYLQKGAQIYVEGSLRTRSWEDKDGTKRYKTEVVAQNVIFLGSKGDGTGSAGGGGGGGSQRQQAGGGGGGRGAPSPAPDAWPDDDIPF